MGVDGIGGGPLKPSGPGKGFDVEGVGSARETSDVAGPDAASGSGAALEVQATPDVQDVDRARLEAGQLSVEQYLEVQVERATAHLEARLSTEQLGAIRDELRAQLASDPVLASLARRATAGGR